VADRKKQPPPPEAPPAPLTYVLTVRVTVEVPPHVNPDDLCLRLPEDAVEVVTVDADEPVGALVEYETVDVSRPDRDEDLSYARLEVTLQDARGNLIETFDADLEAARERIAEFVLLHGADPEERGRGSQAGGIWFKPIH
jgi:hypothetical protein